MNVQNQRRLINVTQRGDPLNPPIATFQLCRDLTQYGFNYGPNVMLELCMQNLGWGRNAIRPPLVAMALLFNTPDFYVSPFIWDPDDHPTTKEDLRYRELDVGSETSFVGFEKQKRCVFFCFAHNRNDELEDYFAIDVNLRDSHMTLTVWDVWRRLSIGATDLVIDILMIVVNHNYTLPPRAFPLLPLDSKQLRPMFGLSVVNGNKTLLFHNIHGPWTLVHVARICVQERSTDDICFGLQLEQIKNFSTTFDDEELFTVESEMSVRFLGCFVVAKVMAGIYSMPEERGFLFSADNIVLKYLMNFYQKNIHLITNAIENKNEVTISRGFQERPVNVILQSCCHRIIDVELFFNHAIAKEVGPGWGMDFSCPICGFKCKGHNMKLVVVVNRNHMLFTSYPRVIEKGSDPARGSTRELRLNYLLGLLRDLQRRLHCRSFTIIERKLLETMAERDIIIGRTGSTEAYNDYTTKNVVCPDAVDLIAHGRRPPAQRVPSGEQRKRESDTAVPERRVSPRTSANAPVLASPTAQTTQASTPTRQPPVANVSPNAARGEAPVLPVPPAPSPPAAPASPAPPELPASRQSTPTRMSLDAYKLTGNSQPYVFRSHGLPFVTWNLRQAARLQECLDALFQVPPQVKYQCSRPGCRTECGSMTDILYHMEYPCSKQSEQTPLHERVSSQFTYNGCFLVGEKYIRLMEHDVEATNALVAGGDEKPYQINLGARPYEYSKKNSDVRSLEYVEEQLAEDRKTSFATFVYHARRRKIGHVVPDAPDRGLGEAFPAVFGIPFLL